jgi:hypothetical protein
VYTAVNDDKIASFGQIGERRGVFVFGLIHQLARLRLRASQWAAPARSAKCSSLQGRLSRSTSRASRCSLGKQAVRLTRSSEALLKRYQPDLIHAHGGETWKRLKQAIREPREFPRCPRIDLLLALRANFACTESPKSRKIALRHLEI